MENLELWNKYAEVPKNALKDFDNGKFKGTDINTMWRIKCLTETFGICGIGWYYIPKRLWTEKCDNGDIFAFAEIELFVKENGKWSKPISGNGGNKLQRMKKDGDVTTSDEAYKMAVTDALGVACRNLGFGANVYWQNDKTKYTEYSVEKSKPAFRSVEEIIPKDVIKCEKCGEIIENRVAEYSTKVYGKPLCRKCQKESTQNLKQVEL